LWQREKSKITEIAFKNAATVVSNTFDFNVPIIVNASFVNLYDDSEYELLGSAGPAKLIPLMDDDGMTRLYPQALVKQLQLPNHYEFNDYDISAEFNSDNSRFWFRGDREIGEEQVDLELLIIHELLHGLGFASSWDDYFNDGILTPLLSFLFKKKIIFFWLILIIYFSDIIMLIFIKLK